MEGDALVARHPVNTGKVTATVRLTGTPALVYEDGKTQPGAVGAEAVERQLAASRKGNS